METLDAFESLSPERRENIRSILAQVNGSIPEAKKLYDKTYAPEIISETVLLLIRKKDKAEIKKERISFLKDLKSINISHRAYRQRMFQRIMDEALDNRCIPHQVTTYRDKERTDYETKWTPDWSTALNALRASDASMAVHEKNKIQRARFRLTDTDDEEAGFSNDQPHESHDKAGDDTGFGARTG